MNTIITGNIDITPLINAELFLDNGLKVATSDLEKAGTIQAFEICYELAWKTMKRILAFRGIEVSSPREVFRLAAQEKLIQNVEFWFEVLLKRNLTSHVYNLKVADEIFKFLPSFSKELNNFIILIKNI